MMDKILISISIPVVNIEVELWIPNSKKIGVLKERVFELLKNNYGFNDFQFLRLVDRLTAEELDGDLLISQSNIKNGTKLILI